MKPRHCFHFATRLKLDPCNFCLKNFPMLLECLLGLKQPDLRSTNLLPQRILATRVLCAKGVQLTASGFDLLLQQLSELFLPLNQLLAN